jgi:Cys/Met metabolism PLP-dependent enzyme/Homoserine dehydrogenase
MSDANGNNNFSTGCRGDSAVHLSTLAIHGGRRPDPATGAVLTPIHQSTTFAQETVGVHKGFTYSRAANPTHPLAQVRAERNGLEIEVAGQPPVFLTGKGAGRWPTTESVLADLFDLARSSSAHPPLLASLAVGRIA